MVRITTPELVRDGDDAVVTAELSGIRPAGTLRYRFPVAHSPTPEAMADAVLPIGLMLAMATDRELVLDAPVSPALLAQSETIQDVFAAWYPETFGRARLEVDTRAATPPRRADRALSTFTGGVDSFYTLHQNSDAISSLLFVHGFDIPLAHREFRKVTSEHLQASAAAAGKELIEGATNLRRFLNPHLKWSSMSHGAAITSFVLLLSGTHGTLYLPASYSYSDLFPWGSHPLVDPLWSTEYLTVHHDGAGATRVAKTRAIAHDRVAQEHLRVCFQRTGDYNCDRCKKCVRTKIALELEGRLGSFATFAEGVDADAVRALGVHSETDLAFARENLDFAYAQGREDFADALSGSIDAYLAARDAPDGTATPEEQRLRAQLEEAHAQILRLEQRPATRAWKVVRGTARTAVRRARQVGPPLRRARGTGPEQRRG
ncbi:hypothetical protein [Krasilnikoviella flava]|uniref:7-cyano-7-deazaguanine synthase (Queuosine biosynthesis) n=1 Tax=Krasilnikoviella flava TaxID=526729 RepID=A0A1T5I9L1_9MICO|nr:hypothetical protein [Krasilnikoviella flava]SKC35876.1 hypothetical protein SAMN04324258_0211 [Krasilnikoviella flava]